MHEGEAKPRRAESVGDKMVRRARAIAKIADSPAPLVVVQAPAGYGKTTLLRQFSELREREGARIVWLRFGESQVASDHFLDRLYTELGRIIGLTDASVDGLVDALSDIEKDVLLVFDDFDRALTPEVKSFFASLLPILPFRARIIIAGRTLPSLPLPRLRLRDRVEILDERNLRFTMNETIEFFSGRPEVSADDVVEMHRKTAGWPAALHFCRQECDDSVVRGGGASAVSGVTQGILDFLAADVFSQLEPDLQESLLSICLPETLCGELAEHLLGLDLGEGHQFLIRLEQTGLFLSRIPEGEGWYRIHAVFRAFLNSQLIKRRPAEDIVELQEDIADWMLTHGRDDIALLHLVEAGNSQLALEVLSRISDGLIAEERLALVVHCAERISIEEIVTHPSVFYAAVIAYGFRREFEKANAILSERRRVLDTSDHSDEAWGLLHSAELFIFAAQDRIAEMGEASYNVEALLNESHGFKYAVSLNAMAYWLAAQSKFENARAALLRARSLHEQSRSAFGQAYQESISSTIVSSRGKVEDALSMLLIASRENDKNEQRSLAAGSVIDAYLANALYETNRLEDARRVLQQSNDMIEQQAIVDPLLTMFLVQARLAFHGQKVKASEVILERAICLGHKYNLKQLVDGAYLELARQATLSGRLSEAAILLEDRDTQLLGSDFYFHASETEGHTVTRARLLIHKGDQSGARKLLIPAIREARALERNRRATKLLIMSALSLQEDGEISSARRAILEALELGVSGGMVRMFLDEGSRMSRLLQETRKNIPRLPDQTQRDALVAYLDRLLACEGTTLDALPSAEVAITADLVENLTAKERAILKLVNQGLSNHRLGERLAISNNTVKWHLRNIYEKLGINNRMQAVTVARHLGLLD